MATKLFANYMKNALAGSVDWDADTIKAVPVTSGYTPNMDTHEFYSSVTSGARAATPVTLGTKTNTVTAGSPTKVCLNAANTTFPSVAAATIVGVVVFKDTGAEGTSPLIAYLDYSQVANGGDLTVDWSDSDGVVKVTV